MRDASEPWLTALASRRSLPSQDAAEQEVDVTSPRSGPVTEGVWQICLTVVASTGVVKVDLPHFKREMPISGVKPARLSLLKLLSGMNRDICPLYYRDEYKRDSNEKDPYFSHAPAWTTLSGGERPTITMTPVMIYEQVSAAAKCVALVKNEVTINILETDGTETPVTIGELHSRNIQVKQVPRLSPMRPTLTSASASSSGVSPSSSSEAQALRTTVEVQARQMANLEAKIAELTAVMNANAAGAGASPIPPPAPASLGAKRARNE